MSRKTSALRVIDLEDGMPRVEEARLRMQHELHVAREQGCKAVKLVHGYGSSGVGGRLRDELQKDLFRLVHEGSLHAIIIGENWRISNETTWEWLKRFPEWKQDADLGRGNKGISIVVL